MGTRYYCDAIGARGKRRVSRSVSDISIASLEMLPMRFVYRENRMAADEAVHWEDGKFIDLR